MGWVQNVGMGPIQLSFPEIWVYFKCRGMKPEWREVTLIRHMSLKWIQGYGEGKDSLSLDPLEREEFDDGL